MAPNRHLVVSNSEGGVVSPLGAVHGYPGHYVADGSVIPAEIGFHPCITIAAVAERTAQSLATK